MACPRLGRHGSLAAGRDGDRRFALLVALLTLVGLTALATLAVLVLG